MPAKTFHQMNRHCDIICFSLSRWDSAISSPALSLAKEFAKNNRVFFVEHPFSWKDYYAEKSSTQIQSRKAALLKGKNIYSNPPSLPASLTIVTSKLTIPINFLPPGFLYDSLAAFNDKIVLKAIRQTIRDHKIKEFIYLNFFDPYFVQKLPADIKPLRSIYQSMDDITQVPYSHRHGTRLEEKTIRNFDYTLCTSKELTRLKSAFSPNVYFHPNAADIDIFRRAATEVLPKPAELQGITQKIIGYTGSIEYRSDFELLKKVAEHHKDKILFFVGPIQGNEHKEAGLDKMPNVIFAGPRKITELPDYLQYFDCVLIPFRKNTLTRSIYPLKINEYLAAGKPVIATHFSEDIYTFRDVAYVVDTHDEFISTIDKAIAENSETRKQARMKVAETNTWEARVKQFWEIISKEPKTQNPKAGTTSI
jgi:teichuronic acid biosynthesis glycosyltransferase TuaH